jgi:Ca-activated chloride channel family protein
MSGQAVPGQGMRATGRAMPIWPDTTQSGGAPLGSIPEQPPWPPAGDERAGDMTWPPRTGAVMAPPAPSRRGWWVTAGVIMLAIAIAGGVLIGVRLASRSDSVNSTAAGATCGGQPVLRVVAAPEFVPVVEAALKGLGGGASASPAGGCSMVQVAAQEPAATLSELGSKAPEAWIPSSSAWLRLAAAGAPKPSGGSAPATVPGFANPVSLARSPVVIAAPRPFAESIGWPDRQTGWAELTGKVAARQVPKFSMANPLRDTTALLSVLGLQTAMARTTPDPGIAQMKALTLRARLSDSETPPAALLTKAGAQSDPAATLRDVGLFPVTEQALFEYSGANHAVPYVGLYPPDGIMEADYPLVLSSRLDPARRDIADRLSDVIRSREFIATLTGRGFRPTAQTAAAAGSGTAVAPNATGLLAQYQQPASLPAQVAEAATIWAQYKRLNYQTLLLVDGSGSMNQEVRDRSGKVTTKAELLRLAGIQAAALFGEDTSLGMWLFGTPTATSPPYTVALPFGPVNESINGVPRRDMMRNIAQTYKAYPQAGTPLYETVLQGVDDMRKRTKPDTVTMVVVLTDGRDQDTRFAMTQQQFMARLTAGRDPQRPVPVFAIGYGADADMAVLTEMAKATGGQAAASNDPGDLASAMAKIFLAAHAQR